MEQNGTGEYARWEDALMPREESAELSLPGAQADPCCMGTEAAGSIEVLYGFVREELADAQKYACFARHAPTQSARKMFRMMSEDEQRHARRLKAVCYLITGKAYCPTLSGGGEHCGGFCAILREFYHEEVCGGFNYLRAAEETLDTCLEKLFTELSGDEYRHAALLLDQLGCHLRG